MITRIKRYVVPCKDMEIEVSITDKKKLFVNVYCHNQLYGAYSEIYEYAPSIPAHKEKIKQGLFYYTRKCEITGNIWNPTNEMVSQIKQAKYELLQEMLNYEILSSKADKEVAKFVNWSALSHHITGNAGAIREKHIPKKYRGVVGKILSSIKEALK